MFAFNLVSAVQYGMMGDTGQFTPVNTYGSGMMGMMQMMTGYGGYNTYGTGMMFLGWITYLLIIALIVATIYWLVKSANHKR